MSRDRRRVRVLEGALFWEEWLEGGAYRWACVRYADVETVEVPQLNGNRVVVSTPGGSISLNLDNSDYTAERVASLITEGAFAVMAARDFVDAKPDTPAARNHVGDPVVVGLRFGEDDLQSVVVPRGLYDQVQHEPPSEPVTMPPMIGEQAWKAAVPKMIGEPAPWSNQNTGVGRPPEGVAPPDVIQVDDQASGCTRKWDCPSDTHHPSCLAIAAEHRRFRGPAADLVIVDDPPKED